MTLEQVRDLLHPVSLFGKFLDAVGLLIQLPADGLALVTGLDKRTVDDARKGAVINNYGGYLKEHLNVYMSYQWVTYIYIYIEGI